ncbi:PhoH family protein [Peptoanaerobacter stomatis]|uniref:PhoH-like protein n=1 Tax=Peptoanaerobacter stomatis TaxID=796937 RepID=J5WV37_9FIRM|nr:PhoH family protein [Peptoanaerobacter stomatis]EJU24607.1 PhoH family protein [Peptoanaerobacter stomatis]NWO25902.1 PhoH family protein [Peptostreptococcaceae bacterium oral taxon 081]
MQENILSFDNAEFEKELFGNYDKNIKALEESYSVNIVLRDSHIVIIGEDNKVVNITARVIEELYNLFKKGTTIDTRLVRYAMDMLGEDLKNNLSGISDDVIILTAKGNAVKAKTLGQKTYIENIKKHDMSICIGPAGTGKTYLAVAMAVQAFKKGEVSRIILTRPAVEAGESLGFLPGDLKDKVDPYLRPLYDALFEMFGSEKFEKHLESGVIEVAPLAFMRGRTLDNSFIILDEAQNTTREQMKMFLTRFGFGSKVVVTGDITQIDLGDNKKSGLSHAVMILDGVKGISINMLTEKDVVRHELVQRIIKQYDKYEKKQEFLKNKGKIKRVFNKKDI